MSFQTSKEIIMRRYVLPLAAACALTAVSIVTAFAHSTLEKAEGEAPPFDRPGLARIPGTAGAIAGAIGVCGSLVGIPARAFAHQAGWERRRRRTAPAVATSLRFVIRASPGGPLADAVPNDCCEGIVETSSA